MLLAVRDGRLSYWSLILWMYEASFLAQRSGDPYEFLVQSALSSRATSEAGLLSCGTIAPPKGIAYVAFDIDRARYESMDSATRSVLHRVCAPIARDAALLQYDYTGPVAIRYYEPQLGPNYFFGEIRPGLIAEVPA